MSLKDKLFSKIADFMYKYKSTEMDKIKSCNVSAKVKGGIITTNGIYVKDIPKKEESGMIDIDKLLVQEIQNNDMKSIVFCDNGRIVCLTNQLGASYVETSPECFELANESIYIMCDQKQSYNNLKEYILQSSKWHNYMEYSEDIPNKQSFEQLFNINSKKQEKTSEESDNKSKEFESQQINTVDKTIEKHLNGNIIQLDGIVSSKGKTFLKRDNRQAKYIDITQEDTYNGKKQKYTVTVSMEDNVLEDYGNDIKIGDKVRVTGKLINYIDKNNKPQSIVNSFDFEILEKKNQKNVEMEVIK